MFSAFGVLSPDSRMLTGTGSSSSAAVWEEDSVPLPAAVEPLDSSSPQAAIEAAIARIKSRHRDFLMFFMGILLFIFCLSIYAFVCQFMSGAFLITAPPEKSAAPFKPVCQPFTDPTMTPLV